MSTNRVLRITGAFAVILFNSLLSSILSLHAAAAPNTGSPSPEAARAVRANYLQMPLLFEANRGQTARPVQFLSHTPGGTLFLTPQEAVLTLQGSSSQPVNGSTGERLTTTHSRSISASAPSRIGALSPPRIGGSGGPSPSTGSPGGPPSPPSIGGPGGSGGPTSVLRIKLLHANPHPQMVGLQQARACANYFIGNDPGKWHCNVPNYQKVRYNSIYPGIDLLYYGNRGGQLEHDFIVAPGADPSRIHLQIQGAASAGINRQGDLLLKVGGGQVQLHKPTLYQEINGVRQPVQGGYVLGNATPLHPHTPIHPHTPTTLLPRLLL